MNDNKHENYEVLNMLGYGLAKFDLDFVREFGFTTKSEFYNYIVQKQIATTVGTVKNRQDLFDPFFDNGRKGWWQKGNTYIHRKIFIDSLFGSLDAKQYTVIVKLYIESKFGVADTAIQTATSPLLKSKFKQLQMTGQEAELFFLNNYQKIEAFENGELEDARLFGDGYDFQVQTKNGYMLAEIKGLQASYGSIRLTENEFSKAEEYKNDYGLVVISNLSNVPKMTVIFNPISKFSLKKQVISQVQITYQSEAKSW